MEDCIFCKIVAGEIPAEKVYEDSDVLAFLDTKPLTKGHCLVIPKIHAENIFDVSQDSLKQVIFVVKKLSKKMKESSGLSGINIVSNNGSLAGQVVAHFHLHLIPRYEQ